MKNGENPEFQAWGPPAFPTTGLALSPFSQGRLFLPLGCSECLLTKRDPSPTRRKPAKSDVLICEPVLVRTGSTGSLPAPVFLRENYLPSFFAYLANGPTFLSTPVEGEEGSDEVKETAGSLAGG